LNDQTLQLEWNALRLTLFKEVAVCEHMSGEVWDNFLHALTEAYDYEVPVYSIYRPLRTFAVARWPLLKAHCKNEKILREVTEVLRHSIVQRENANADALETEMELLRQLLDDDR